MGYIKMTHRKVLRRSRPHGPRGKRIEPTVEQGLDEIAEDADAAMDELYYEGWADEDNYEGSLQESLDKAYEELDEQKEKEQCPNCGMNCIHNPCYSL